jgi:hypothetical protein
VEDDRGGWHLFYSRWPRKLGHNAWVTHSEIAHATGPTPLGPWQHRDAILARVDQPATTCPGKRMTRETSVTHPSLYTKRP